MRYKEAEHRSFEIDTSTYELTYRRKPRGRGTWVFTILHSYRAQGRDYSYPDYLYSIAERKVLSRARKEKAVAVVLNGFASTPYPSPEFLRRHHHRRQDIQEARKQQGG